MIGNTIRRSRELDCSPIEVDGAVEPSLRHVTVKTETACSGAIEGIFSASSRHLQLPRSGSFWEMYGARLVQSLASGDCGRWVRDGTTRRIFSRIFAGS